MEIYCKALILISTSLICLSLDVCYVLMSCRSLLNSIFSTNCCRRLLRLTLGLICFLFVISSFISGVIRHMRILFATHCICFTIFILSQVFFLSYPLCVTYELHHYTQLHRFKSFYQYK